MDKIFFIIGMRRSGTSILRTLLLKHPEIKVIEFEPHPLWNAVDLVHFKRYESYPGVQEAIKEFKSKGSGNGWHGAKFALNPGIKAMEWEWLPRTFPNARFVFIVRQPKETYRSYYREDKDAVRGYIPEDAYLKLWDLIVRGFNEYIANNPKKACSLKFESIVENAEKELEKTWRLLEISAISGLNGLMRRP